MSIQELNRKRRNPKPNVYAGLPFVTVVFQVGRHQYSATVDNTRPNVVDRACDKVMTNHDLYDITEEHVVRQTTHLNP